MPNEPLDQLILFAAESKLIADDAKATYDDAVSNVHTAMEDDGVSTMTVAYDDGYHKGSVTATYVAENPGHPAINLAATRQRLLDAGLTKREVNAIIRPVVTYELDEDELTAAIKAKRIKRSDVKRAGRTGVRKSHVRMTVRLDK